MDSCRPALLLVLAFILLPATRASGASASHPSKDPRPVRAQYHPDLVLTSSRSSGVRFKAPAGPDTFALYGGPGNPTDACGRQGKFQDAVGFAPSELGHDQGCPRPPDCWFGVDATDRPTLWQIAPNAEVTDADVLGPLETLNSHGAGNHAAWAGRSSIQEPGWAAAPGYGNSWNAFLVYTQQLVDPSVAQTVGLSFAFHHDSEPTYDFFRVEYDSFNTTVVAYEVDGSDAPFAAPGVQYPDDVIARPIHFDAHGYAGPGHDEIRIRLVAASDNEWSDEDGEWTSSCGHTMVDDIAVTTTEGSTLDIFEGPTWTNWAPERSPFAGDFSAIYPRLGSDIDPCRENKSPVVAFVDTGQCPVNGDNNCGQTPCSSTGGSTSYTWPWGGPPPLGGWVVNFTGGLSNGVVALNNSVWSPEIAWDLPGTEDDGDPTIAGSKIKFSVWKHLPIVTGIFYIWNVRSTIDGGATWSSWASRDFVYFSREPSWVNQEIVITDLVNQMDASGTRQLPTAVQIELGVWDLADTFGLPGNDATASPAFDNVSLFKFRQAGPMFATRNIDLFMDSFPQSGETDFATLAGRQNSDCRIDTRDVSSGVMNVPGDSMICDIIPSIAGTTIERVQLKWILDKNPLFDDARVMPAGTTVIPQGAPNGWDQWTGVVGGDSARVSSGTPVPDRFFFDLPDADFAHPGDVIRYYLEAEDSDGHITTLPAVTDGFDAGRGVNGELYAESFTLHMLPSVIDEDDLGLFQPRILVWNDFGFRGGINDYYQAFYQNGWRRGIDWDMYTTWGPTSGVSNGLGSAGAHGATPDQLAGYRVILHFAGDLGTTVLSDGTNTANNDKGNDIGTMTGWFNADADRFLAYFCDDAASALIEDSPAAGGTYVQNVLGIHLIDNIVKDDINDQTAPVVVPAPGSPCFVEEYVAFGGCPAPNEFDNIGPLAGAVQSHFFTMPDGVTPYPANGTRCASVMWNRLDGNGNRKISITFPYGFVYVWNKSSSTRPNPNPAAGPDSQRARLLKEIIEDCFGHFLGTPEIVAVQDAPAFRGIRDLATFPNPFNPAATIAFDLGAKSRVTVSVYNLRGQLVTTLANAVMDAGPVRVVWQGKDDAGQPVASGIYLVQASGDGASEVQKIALIR